MIPVLKTCTPGVHTSVQDFGRTGYRHLGVPTSGALCRSDLRLVNRLVGNAATTAGLEIIYQGPVFEVQADSVRIALSGTGGSIEVLDMPDGIFPAWQSVRLVRGQKFKITISPDLACCYLAIEGGFDLAPVMGSQSTCIRAGFGGHRGRILASGDKIPLKLNSVENGDERTFATPPDLAKDAPVRITWGQQVDYFTTASREVFITREFTILPTSDRMGYRLSGARIEHKNNFDIVSDATSIGAIQVPGDGAPIVLLADCQTTGGYPKIATVISSDVEVLARRPPGSKVCFSAVSVSDAETIARNHETALGTIENSLMSVSHGLGLNVDALYEANLISGMFDAENPQSD